MSSIGSPMAWAGFAGLLLAMLALDLGVLHRRPHQVSTREAAIWSGVWIAVAAAFGIFVLVSFGEQRALEFATGYLIEKALAVDNLFVFVVVFGALGLPRAQQHRVLFWGVLGALVMRAGLVIAGGIMLQRFHWAMYLFGAALAAGGVKLLFVRGSAGEGFAVRLARRLVPAADATLLALVAIELTDIAFAVESIPAVYAVTSDPFIVFTSNALALLGMRALYFLLADWLERFRAIKPALALVLVFVGAKMLLGGVVEISPLVSVGVIAALLAGALLLSRRRTATFMSRPQRASS